MNCRPIAALAVLAAAVLPGAAPAATLAMSPNATRVVDTAQPLGALSIPVAPFDGQTVPALRAEGRIVRQVWQEPLQGRSTLQVLAPLRAQLLDSGFQVILDCVDRGCGGFDFRFATDTVPEPQMHVDLGDYHFVSARRLTEGGPDYAMLMVSRSATRAFVQLTRVAPAAASSPAPDPPDPPGAARAAPQMIADLERVGHVVLDDLAFATGAVRLADGPRDMLDALAAYLRAQPDRAVVLVGHSDAVGRLADNIALSRQRAAAVRAYLVQTGGVPDAQLSAEGVGYLAPIASNLTEAGRRANRRVEAVLLGGP